MIIGDPETMQESLTHAERKALLSFLGFGNPRAPFVFIGMEEGLTETPAYPLLAQLRDRAKLPKIADLRASEVHPEKYLMGQRPPIQRTWNALICILLSFCGQTNPSNDTIRFYQRDCLGTLEGQSLLLEFLPLPARSIANWTPYNRYFPEFPDRETYFDLLRQPRAKAIREHLGYGPKLVVAYGSGYWPEYRSLFPLVDRWEARGIFECAHSGPTAIVLMPHPVSRQMNGNRRALCALALAAAG